MAKCLVVDDSRFVRIVERHIVEGLGFEAIEAENGQQALAVCQAGMPELILLDWNMPVLNGVEFIIALRAMAGGGAPKVVFCTTEHDTAHVRQGLESGADEYVMKPFGPETLQQKLRHIGMDVAAASVSQPNTTAPR